MEGYGAGSKWLPVHTLQEQLPEKQSRGVQKAYKLLSLATLTLNLLYAYTFHCMANSTNSPNEYDLSLQKSIPQYMLHQ